MQALSSLASSSSSNSQYELIELILEEQFSKEVSDVGKDLLYNGPSTIHELELRLKLDYASIRNVLIILLQNQLVTCKEVKRKENKENAYELITENILNYLRFPKILYMITHKFGEFGVMIFEEFMQFGILSASQVFEQVKYKLQSLKKSTMTSANSVKMTFISMIESGFLIQTAKCKNEELKPKTKGEKKKGGGSNKAKKKKGMENKEKDMEVNEEFNGNGDKGKSFVDNVVVEADNPLIYNKEKGKYFYYFFNYERILVEFKVQIVVDLISQKIGGQAGLIASILLEKNPWHSFKEGKTFPMTSEEILGKLSGGESITQSSTSKYLKSTSEKKNSHSNSNEKINSFTYQIEELLNEQNDFFMRLTSDNSLLTICLNLAPISQFLKERTLEKIIEQQYSSIHVRIYRLLSLCGALDVKSIMEICLTLPRDCNTCLNQLYSEGYLEAQPVNMKGGVILFYSVNTKHNLELMLEKVYKIIRNLKYFLKSEIETIKNTVSPLMQEQYITKVYATIAELDDTILVLKYF